MNHMTDKFHKILDCIGFLAVTIVGTIALFVIVWYAQGMKFPSLGVLGYTSTVAISAIVVALISAHFIVVFTRDLPEQANSNSNRADSQMSHKLRAVFIYGYVIMLASLCFSALPFLVPFDNVARQHPALVPAGVIVGCRSGDCQSVETDPQWYLHIGSSLSWVDISLGSATESDGEARIRGSSGVFVLNGGMRVPLYVVVLALMGGAVSMIRRVPEYQRQVLGELVKTDEKEISPIRARELIVFQIMQLFSAPLLAITSFAVLDPGTVMLGALLGFFSGFASESILLRLRTAADSLSGRFVKPANDDSNSHKQPEAKVKKKA